MSKEKEKKQGDKKNKSSVNKKTEENKNKKNVTEIKETKAEKEERIIEAEYDEDLDEVVEEFDEDIEIEFEEDEDEDVVEEIKVNDSKSKKESNKKKEEETIKIEKVPAKKNIEKIEKIAKDKKKKTNKNNSKLSDCMFFFEKNHVAIFSFIGGIFITTLIALIIWPDRIATLKNGEQPVVKVNKENYTADELYENMKDYYSVSLLLDDIDNDILTKMYPEDKTLLEEVEANAENYYNMYKQYYNYTKEQFLEQNGFSSHEAFVDYLKLDYRRNKYLDEYVEKQLKDDEIEDYYKENVFGDINTQHILVEVSSSEEDSDKLSDEDAKKLAEKIITKLNDGTSWKDVQKKYKDKITFEDLGYQSWDASLEESFMKALKDMDDESYSEEPVKTSYGYHVIYRKDQKKTPTLKKSKEKIVENLIAEKKEKDANLLYKSLISLREEKNIKFNDTVMKEKYEKYCKQYKK